LGGAKTTLIRSATWLVLPLADRGAFRAGIEHGHAALHRAKGAQDIYGIVSADYCLAYLYCLKGELDLAIPLLERGLALCREREFGVWLPQVTGYLGYAYAHTGRIEEGRSLLEQAADIFEATRARPFRTLLTVHQGMAEMLAGRLDVARTLAHRALALAREHGERGHEAWALRLYGETSARSDPLEARQADRYYLQASALATLLGMRPLVAHCHLGLGQLYGRAADGARAREHLTTAAAMYREMDMGLWLTQAETALG
jgi:tetratricopeptide (TPR) repeat protein